MDRRHRDVAGHSGILRASMWGRVLGQDQVIDKIGDRRLPGGGGVKIENPGRCPLGANQRRSGSIGIE